MAKRSIGYELSKSTLIRSVQCQKSLYLYKYYSQLREKPSYTQQATFNRGHNVGYLAQQLFPNGKDLTPSSPIKWQQSALATQHYIQIREPVLYEAAFINRQVLVAVDVLVFNGKNWDVYEVKSSLKISETYLQDAAIQYHIIKNCGVDINQFFIVNLNGDYVRKGDLDIQKLFKITDVTQELIARKDKTQQIIDNAIETLLAGNVPDIRIGGHCVKPYPCDFMQHCWGDKMQTEVFQFGGMNLEEKANLLSSGVENISEEILKDIPSINKTILNAHFKNEPVYDIEQIKTILSPLSGSLYFVDIEAFQPAIPLYDNSCPYETIPFLSSILYFNKAENSEKENVLFVKYSGTEDLRKDFLKQFLDLTKEPIPIVVYGKSFEKNVLWRLGNLYPEYRSEVEDRANRIVDLSSIFLKNFYYHPMMNGSVSLKAIIDALKPNFFENIYIKEGREAAAVYEEYLHSKEKHKQTETRLIEYCSADTRALLEVWKHLEKLV